MSGANFVLAGSLQYPGTRPADESKAAAAKKDPDLRVRNGRIQMSVQKKSLISNRTAVKKALVAKQSEPVEMPVSAPAKVAPSKSHISTSKTHVSTSRTHVSTSKAHVSTSRCN